MRALQTPWTQTAPVALTQIGPAPRLQVETYTCMDTWAPSWPTASTSLMNCSGMQGPQRIGCSPPRGSTYSVQMGL